MKKITDSTKKANTIFSLKSITLLLLAFLAIVSCSKSDDEVVPEPAQKFRIKEIINAGSYTEFYNYNNRNQITKRSFSNQNYTENYEYDSNGYLVRFEGKDAPANISSLNKVITYTNDNQGNVLEDIDAQSPTNKRKNIYTYTNGFLTELTTYNFTNTGNGWSATFRNEFTNNSAGKPISTVIRQYNPETYTWALFGTSSSTYTSANLIASNVYVGTDGREQKVFYEYDTSGGYTKFQGFTKANANAAFVKYNETTYTKDNVKPVVQDYFNNVISGNGNQNNLFSYYQNKNITTYRLDTNTGVETNENDTYTHEYNKDGYVTKTFKNGTLQTTYVLELAN